ncbi:hypothetical protein C8R44DRAFT_887512 [Mycena epipterygia]|nr:hypothetical protein C8R44DRAFT_887512 [Mycena epipterygia]
MSSRRRFKPQPPDFGLERTDPKVKELAANNINLRNPKFFPAYKNSAETPLCYLGEIMDDETALIRVVLVVKDKDGQYIRVAFYFDDDANFDYKSIKIGSTIAVLYAEMHNFFDGTIGLRLEHPKFVKIFPCNLATLLRVNEDIESETPVDCAQKCKGCGQEERPDKISLMRCSRCFGASYCGRECQTDAWNQGHKHECKIFTAVNELKRGRDWKSWTMAGDLEWISFGQKTWLGAQDERPVDSDDRVQPDWKDAKPAQVTELKGTFTVTSGELLWGQLTSVLKGLVNPAHDLPTPNEDKAEPNGTVMTQGYSYRALAKVGVWKTDTDSATGLRIPGLHTTRLTNLPSNCSFLPEASPEKRAPRTLVLKTARIFAKINPESGWPAANERHKRLGAVDKYTCAGHPDHDRWQRLSKYDAHNIFLVDAANGAEVLKVLTRPSKLDEHVRAKESSFLSNQDASESKEPFGCNLAFLGEEWEFARLVFSESETFPGEKELVGFWYDQDNRYNNAEFELERKLEEPLFEIV